MLPKRSSTQSGQRRGRRLVAEAVVVIAAVSLTANVWLEALGRDLVCQGEIAMSDVVLIENLDHDYLCFERAAQLVGEGWAARVLVPVRAGRNPERPGAVDEGIIQVMARIARIQTPERIPVRQEEPITLNAALQVRDYLRKEAVKSVILVTEGFRSQRSFLIWNKTLEPAGIKVSCVPVFGERTPENWRESWHGWEHVALQFLKLQYYRLFIL